MAASHDSDKLKISWKLVTERGKKAEAVEAANKAAQVHWDSGANLHFKLQLLDLATFLLFKYHFNSIFTLGEMIMNFFFSS